MPSSCRRGLADFYRLRGRWLASISTLKGENLARSSAPVSWLVTFQGETSWISIPS
jgi:hypothetical protein